MTAQLDVEALVGRFAHAVSEWSSAFERGLDCTALATDMLEAKAALLAHIAGEDARVAASVAGERKRCALLGFDHAEMWRERRDEPGYDQVIAAAAWDATHDLAAAIRETPSA